MSDKPADKQKFLTLQAYRGIAAVVVVYFHVSHSIFGTRKYWLERPFGTVFEFGHVGVEFFFVLSGFIILAVHRADIGQAGRLPNFASKRLRRIYPAYWVILALIIPVFYFDHGAGAGFERDPATWVDSTLLVHVLRSGGQVLSVSWTLFHEVLFYTMFAVLIADRRIGGAVMLAWLLACAALYLSGAAAPEWVGFYFSPMHLLFAMGMFAAWATASPRRISRPRLLAVIGAAGLAATSIAEVTGSPPSSTLSLCYGLGSTALIIGSVELERAGLLRAPNALVVLGNASYSIYLIHILALSVSTKLVRVAIAHGFAPPLKLVFIVLGLIGIAAGLAYHFAIEAPLLRWLAGRRSGRLRAVTA